MIREPERTAHAANRLTDALRPICEGVLVHEHVTRDCYYWRVKDDN